MTQKDEKIQSIIKELAAEYFSRNSNRQSMITVTRVELLSRGAKAMILMTVLPETDEGPALEFAQRQLTNLRKYVEEHSRLGRIPYFEIMIDIGEKNRQHIDDISKSL